MHCFHPLNDHSWFLLDQDHQSDQDHLFQPDREVNIIIFSNKFFAQLYIINLYFYKLFIFIERKFKNNQT